MQAQATTWFPWKDAYSVQVPEIDEQHKRLVAIINRLQDAMLQGRGRAVIESVLNDLEDYTRTHFTFEEQLLAKSGYPKLVAHEAQHKGFIAKLTQLRDEYRSGSITMSVQVMEFVREWLTQHILQEDKAYSEHMTLAIAK